MTGTGYFLRGILIGLMFGVPVGAVGTMTVQNTFHKGIKAGLLTGLGSSAADCIYACIGVFGLTFVSDFLLKYQTMIHIFGGGFILFMGIRLLRAKADIEAVPRQMTGKIRLFLSSFAVGITNPAAILTFLFAFSWFGITGESGGRRGILLVGGVFIGTYFWWSLLSFSAYRVKRRFGGMHIGTANKIFGTFLILFGTAIFIQTIF